MDTTELKWLRVVSGSQKLERDAVASSATFTQCSATSPELFDILQLFSIYFVQYCTNNNSIFHP